MATTIPNNTGNIRFNAMTNEYEVYHDQARRTNQATGE